VNPLVVDPKHLLAISDDAAFHRSWTIGHRNETLCADAFYIEEAPEASSCIVGSNNADQRGRHLKSGQVHGYVRSAPGAIAFPIEMDNRDRRLRGHAINTSPEVSIEHEVADDGDVGRFRSIKKVL